MHVVRLFSVPLYLWLLARTHSVMTQVFSLLRHTKWLDFAARVWFKQAMGKLHDSVGNSRHCYKGKGSADNLAHAHLRRFNIIHNYKDTIVIM